MKRTTLSFELLALVMAFAATANAQCGLAKAKTSALLIPTAKLDSASRLPHASDTNAPAVSIVGLWDATFTVGGQLVDEGFDQWHSDGTEILNDIPEPASGNVCLGVWTQSGDTISLNHPFWIFDSNNVNLIGRGVIQQQLTVDAEGKTYSGTFTIQYRDLTGNPLPALPDGAGDVSAVRITATPSGSSPSIKVTTVSGTTANANGLLQTPINPLLLDASGSTGSGALTFAWSANPPVTLAGTQTPGQIEVNFPSAGDYVLNLKVTDSQGNVGTFSVTVEFTGKPE